MKMPPPLSPELEALLASHRAVLPLAPAIEARAVARAAAVAESRERAGSGGFVLSRWAFAVAAGAVLSFGAGAYAAYAWRVVPPSRAAGHPAPIVATQANEPSPAVPDTAEADESDTAGPIAPSPAPHAKRKVSSAGRSGAAPVQPTNAELQLLRSARQDVTRGDFTGALTAIAEHARRFRNGALVEEREALRVKSLAGLGRREDAQRAAAQFHARFPHSVFLSTFERMKETDR
jgi:hypothetical protein